MEPRTDSYEPETDYELRHQPIGFKTYQIEKASWLIANFFGDNPLKIKQARSAIQEQAGNIISMSQPFTTTYHKNQGLVPITENASTTLRWNPVPLKNSEKISSPSRKINFEATFGEATLYIKLSDKSPFIYIENFLLNGNRRLISSERIDFVNTGLGNIF